jgi:hypothetical protein
MHATAEPIIAEVPKVAFTLGLHEMTSFDMGRKIRAMIDARPSCGFGGLRPGHTYFYGKDHYNGPRVFRMGEMTPKRTQATVSFYPDGIATRVYAGNFRGVTFLELDDDLVSLTPVSHEMVITEAIARSLPVPPRVRCEYPQLFIEVPERFARTDGPEHMRHTAGERVRDCLKPYFSLRVIGPDTVHRWIEEAHRDIARLLCERTRRVAINPAVAEDYDRHIKVDHDNIDFYRWLLPHVSPGGAFHIPDQPEED